MIDDGIQQLKKNEMWKHLKWQVLVKFVVVLYNYDVRNKNKFKIF